MRCVLLRLQMEYTYGEKNRGWIRKVRVITTTIILKQVVQAELVVVVLPCREDATLDGTGDRVSCPAASSDRSGLWPSPSSQKSARSRVIKCTTSRSTSSRCISPYWYARHSLPRLIYFSICWYVHYQRVMAIPSPHAPTVDRCK
jgi:hypothetical protein